MLNLIKRRMTLLTLASVVISTLGMVAGDSHGTGWTKVGQFVDVDIDFDKSKLEVYRTINPNGPFEFGFDFMDDQSSILLGWKMSGNGKNTGKWRFQQCMTVGTGIKMKDEDFAGKKIWSFSKKNGLLSVTIDGKEVIAEKAPGEADTKCENNDWKSYWEKKVESVIFSAAEEYRIVPDQKNNGGNNNPGSNSNSDRNRINGSSKSCLNVSVLVSSLVAYLRI